MKRASPNVTGRKSVAASSDKACVIEALQQRRRRAAELADELADRLDRFHDPALRARLDLLAKAIDRLDELIEQRRRE